jgi:Ca2+-binding RTX toxin-like protein
MRTLGALKTVFAVAGTLAATAAGAYAGALLTPFGASSSGSSGSSNLGVVCDGSVRVGYDVAYSGGSGGYVVRGVSVADISPGCAGNDVVVALGTPGGVPLAGGVATGRLGSTGAQLALDAPVLASAVGTLNVAINSAPDTGGGEGGTSGGTVTTPGTTTTTTVPTPGGQGKAPPCGRGTLFGARVVGSEGNDCLYGTAGADVILGMGGNDLLAGAAGADRLLGGAGNDLISGGNGNDRAAGGPGVDRVDGGNGKDRLYGGIGNDTLRGGAGNDRLEGNGGRDRIEGGAGSDYLIGGPGNDRLIGGPGFDTCVPFGGRDTMVSCERLRRR